MPNQPLSPEIIDQAPIEPEVRDFDAQQSSNFIAMVGVLSAEVEELRAANERLKAKQDFEQVRAQMAEPYANKVFGFLVGYCVVVAAIIGADGFAWTGFHISDAVLGIVAGSTAVAAIGLVGFVVNGLFGSRSPKA